MKKEIKIALSGSHNFDSAGSFANYRRAYVNHDYVRSIQQAGGIPLILPFVEGERSEEIIRSILESTDGVILTGGHDFYPPFYGMEAHQKLQEVWPERDLFDRRVYETALELGKPVFGICRGFQLINLFAGECEILQDLSEASRPLLKHSQGHSPSMMIHEVRFEKDSFFGRVFGERAMTNSFHHLAVLKEGRGLRPVAWTSDGVIEAVEAEEKKLIACQFHPEMTSGVCEKMAGLFRAFVELCA